MPVSESKSSESLGIVSVADQQLFVTVSYFAFSGLVVAVLKSKLIVG